MQREMARVINAAKDINTVAVNTSASNKRPAERTPESRASQKRPRISVAPSEIIDSADFDKSEESDWSDIEVVENPPASARKTPNRRQGGATGASPDMTKAHQTPSTSTTGAATSGHTTVAASTPVASTTPTISRGKPAAGGPKSRLPSVSPVVRNSPMAELDRASSSSSTIHTTRTNTSIPPASVDKTVLGSETVDKQAAGIPRRVPGRRGTIARTKDLAPSASTQPVSASASSPSVGETTADKSRPTVEAAAFSSSDRSSVSGTKGPNRQSQDLQVSSAPDATGTQSVSVATKTITSKRVVASIRGKGTTVKSSADKATLPAQSATGSMPQITSAQPTSSALPSASLRQAATSSASVGTLGNTAKGAVRSRSTLKSPPRGRLVNPLPARVPNPQGPAKRADAIRGTRAVAASTTPTSTPPRQLPAREPVRSPFDSPTPGRAWLTFSTSGLRTANKSPEKDDFGRSRSLSVDGSGVSDLETDPNGGQGAQSAIQEEFSLRANKIAPASASSSSGSTSRLRATTKAPEADSRSKLDPRLKTASLGGPGAGRQTVERSASLVIRSAVKVSQPIPNRVASPVLASAASLDRFAAKLRLARLREKDGLANKSSPAGSGMQPGPALSSSGAQANGRESRDDVGNASRSIDTRAVTSPKFGRSLVKAFEMPESGNSTIDSTFEKLKMKKRVEQEAYIIVKSIASRPISPAITTPKPITKATSAGLTRLGASSLLPNPVATVTDTPQTRSAPVSPVNDLPWSSELVFDFSASHDIRAPKKHTDFTMTRARIEQAKKEDDRRWNDRKRFRPLGSVRVVLCPKSKD